MRVLVGDTESVVLLIRYVHEPQPIATHEHTPHACMVRAEGDIEPSRPVERDTTPHTHTRAWARRAQRKDDITPHEMGQQ